MRPARAAYTESADILRRTGNVSVLSHPVRRLGYLALLELDRDRVATLYMQSMRLHLEVGDRQGASACLVGLAAVAEASRQYDWAARLLGAADAMVEAIQMQLPLFDVAHRERTEAAVRSRLDAGTFSALWMEGRRMPLKHVAATIPEWATSGCAQPAGPEPVL